MAHVAFARKYRPRSFDEVVGQEAIAQALRGAVAAARTAPVYLFSGSHGVGKTSMARIFAKALNCTDGKDGAPCLACSTCLSVDRGEAIDVIEIDAASHRSVDDAERIRQNVQYKAQGGAFKVYILDEVHQLSRTAFDALLKTFEEAPSHVRFVLATTELHKVPQTIRSRAQVFHFRRAGRQAMEHRLGQIVEQEGVAIEPAALGIIARRARGSMRDGQKMLDQVVSLGAEPGTQLGELDVARLLGAFTDDQTERLLTGIAAGDPAALLAEVAELLAGGGQVGTFLDELMTALRAALYAKTCGADSDLLEAFTYDRELLARVGGDLGEEALLYALQVLAEVEQKLRIAREPRVLLEVALVRLARARELRPIGEVLARLERLEQSLGGGGPSGGPPRETPTRGRAGSASALPPRAADRERPAPAPAASPPPEPARPAPPVPAGPTRAGGFSGGQPQPPRGGAPAAAAAAPAPAGRGTYAYPESVRGTAPSPARALAEADREARHAPTGGGRLVAPAVREAWNRMQADLPSAIGMAAEALTESPPRVDVDAEGAIRLEVTVGTFVWNQLNTPRSVERLAQLFSDRLGTQARVRFERAQQQESAGGGAGGGLPLSEEPIVKLARRELDATPMDGV